MSKADQVGVHTFENNTTMFAQMPTDIVCVSTWPPSHLEVAQAALDLALTGILVEKPLGDTWSAGRTVLDAVRAKGIPMTVPHRAAVPAALSPCRGSGAGWGDRGRSSDDDHLREMGHPERGHPLAELCAVVSRGTFTHSCHSGLRRFDTHVS